MFCGGLCVWGGGRALPSAELLLVTGRSVGLGIVSEWEGPEPKGPLMGSLWPAQTKAALGWTSLRPLQVCKGAVMGSREFSFYES